MSDNIEFCNIAERCVDHKEVIVRLERLERDLQELAGQLRNKVDSLTLEGYLQRNTKEIEALKTAVAGLDSADAKHSQALAGIYEVLKGFKETQDLLRQDYSKLSDCYHQTSIHIASLTTVLKERSKSVIPKAEEEKGLWGAIKLVVKNKIIVYCLAGLLIALIFILISEQETMLKMLDDFLNGKSK